MPRQKDVIDVSSIVAHLVIMIKIIDKMDFDARNPIPSSLRKCVEAARRDVENFDRVMER